MCDDLKPVCLILKLPPFPTITFHSFLIQHFSLLSPVLNSAVFLFRSVSLRLSSSILFPFQLSICRLSLVCSFLFHFSFHFSINCSFLIFSFLQLDFFQLINSQGVTVYPLDSFSFDSDGCKFMTVSFTFLSSIYSRR